MLMANISSLDVTSCLILFLLLAITLYFISRKKENLPPSPGLALPVIGHLYMLEKNPRKQFEQWAKKFGAMFTLRMGSITVVVLNGYDIMKDTLVKQAVRFSDRPSKTFLQALPNYTDGVMFSSGENWKEQRTTCLNILRDFGMGKNILSERIGKEVSVYLEEIAKMRGKPTDLRNLTNTSVSNVICSIIFGKRFDFDDPKFTRLITLVNYIVQLLSGVAVLNFLPVLRHIPLDPFKGKLILSKLYECRNFNREMISEIKANCDLDNVDSFVVSYIKEIEKKQKAGEPTHLDEANLSRSIDNLFAAGTETTSTTIIWCMLYMLHYPEVQAKVVKEIQDNVGSGRKPTMMDKAKLTYLNAVIMETQRIASIVPLSIPHECNTDTVVNGYTIPKGTLILPNLDSVLRDEKIWCDPHNFRPERFIDAGGHLKTQQEFVPFSLGRRVCLGESLAKMELFLYLSALFQRFELLPADPENIPPLKDIFGITTSPEPFKIRCIMRPN